MLPLDFAFILALSLHVRDCDCLISKYNPDRLLLEDFGITLTSVDVQSPSEGSLDISASFKSSFDVTSVWFVDRDMPIIGGDPNFISFSVNLKPFYTARLVSTLSYDLLLTKDIRLQLTANGYSMYIDINTTNILDVQRQSFNRMRYRSNVETEGLNLRTPTPLFDIQSNVEADKLIFYPINRKVDTYGGGGLLSYTLVDLGIATATRVTHGTVIEDPESEVAVTYLQVGYSTGLVSNLLLGIQFNPSSSPTALPQGTFEFLRDSIYYKDLKTGSGVEGKLYRCSAIGNVQLQILIDNEGTYSNGTYLPYFYVENGFERDLYVVRRPKESCTPAVFCQATYRYRDSPRLSKTTHQLPPRYGPWYNVVDMAEKTLF